MKKLIFATALIVLLTGGFLFNASAEGVVKGMSANGSTGLISTPTARIGWENSNLGIDVGYKFTGGSHIPMVEISFLRMAEVGVAVDIQGQNNVPVLINGKFQFNKSGNTSFAMGGNLQLINSAVYGQVYVAIGSTGSFFDWPAVTTVVLGTTFPNFLTGFPIDFSMGYEMTVWPSALRDYVHMIVDFANYSYSVQPAGGIGTGRGILNAGLRIDPLKGTKFKLNIDIIGTDLLDANRGYLLGVCFGFSPM